MAKYPSQSSIRTEGWKVPLIISRKRLRPESGVGNLHRRKDQMSRLGTEMKLAAEDGLGSGLTFDEALDEESKNVG